MNSLNNLECVTLFVDDLARTRAFYEAAFDARPIYSDAVCSVIGLGGVMVNLLQETEAPQLVEPMVPAASSTGPRMLMTIRVADVDEACAKLRQNGVELVNGPIDRPWGRRTAAFADPSGHMWEIAQEIRS
ncbi:MULTISPECIES: VOC family protein [Bradyrhizobium]|uniref:VOC family protein n=1 Tax=Bradyrhizobium TaxID=374 RepID=UPI001EDB0134|nr:VOC family protein [Bradyrhizobium zhengyangense]MCG2637928.1 VOC family protein [Bradyrhizobium zhengyangense]